MATGCSHKITQDVPYKEKKPNKVLNDLFVQNVESLGRGLFPRPDLAPKGSTDLGDVSHVVPTIGAYLDLCGPGISLHSKEFHEASIGDAAWKMIADSAKAMAFTAVDVLALPEKMDEMKKSFINQED